MKRRLFLGNFAIASTVFSVTPVLFTNELLSPFRPEHRTMLRELEKQLLHPQAAGKLDKASLYRNQFSVKEILESQDGELRFINKDKQEITVSRTKIGISLKIKSL